MKKIALIIILNCCVCVGQNKKNIDSLKAIISQSKIADSSKVNAYTDLIYEFMYVNKDSTLYYSNKLFDFSEKKDSDYARYQAHYSKAFYYYTTSNYDSVINSLEKSIIYTQKLKNTDFETESHLKLGGVYSRLNKSDKAIYHIEIAKTLAEKNKNWISLGYAHLDYGNVYFFNNELDKAIYHFQKTDSILSIHKSLGIGLGNALSNIGLIYLNLNQNSKAEEYFLRTKELFSKMNYNHGLQMVKGRLGEIDFRNKNYDAAIIKLTESLEYYKKIDDVYKAAEGYMTLGSAYYDNNQKTLAFEALDNAMQLKKRINDSLGQLSVLLVSSEMRLKNNQPEKSLELADEALLYSRNLASLNNEENALLLLSESYSSLKNFDKAYKFKVEHSKLKDSLLKVQNLKQTEELETKYQTEKKEQQIALLKSEKELTEEKQKSQRNILIGGLGLTTVAGLFLFFLYKNRQKTNTKLKELDKVKSNFFANISHEFRTPLTLITHPIEKTLQDESISKNTRDEFTMAKQNSDRLLSLVNQLLDLSKIDAGQLKLRIQKSNPIQIVAAISESFNYTAEQKNISYSINTTHINDQVWFDKDALEKITINLISNALKYTPEKGSVICNASIKDNHLNLEVKNTGKGLTQDEVKHIFQRFYQTSEDNQGTGIGLALVKELVELHKGNISVESKPNEWTTFTVTLPVDKNSFKNEQFVNTEVIEPIPTRITQETTNEDTEPFIENDQPILLIVEDNADVRSLLKQTFEADYNIVTAVNGEEGIRLALENIPDIIISDIMMPIKDGIELTNQLKNDERTCHIPIILLTAKAGEENELIGIKTGADDYITKPFSSNLLKAKVAKIVETRALLHKRYSQEVILTPKDIALTDIDEQFLEKVKTVLDDYLIESSFNVENFSKAVGMSRMQLHRKLKALTGLSASEFIRSQRLKLAAQLLKSSDTNISQVGYAVGFNDHSYFTKCFKEAYNCTPTEYANRK